jgi:hypothetical protein
LPRRTAQLAHGVDVNDAVRRLKAALAKIPNIAGTPAPVVEVIDFTAMGPPLAVRPYTHTDHDMARLPGPGDALPLPPDGLRPRALIAAAAGCKRR